MMKDKKNGNYIKHTIPYETYQDININNDIIEFYMKYNQLKNLYRQGWLKIRIGNEYKDKCESVAEHSFSMALLALTIIEKHKLPYDVLKCLKMCIIHELGEIYVGDYTPLDTVTKEQKYEEERQAIKQIVDSLDFEHDFLVIWEEFEENKTEEAKFVKNLDQLEFLLQASCYELDVSYMKRSLSKIDDPYCKELAEDLLRITKGKNLPVIKD